LPEIFFKPAKTGGRIGKIPEPFEGTLMEYYKLRGWDEQGIVLESKIKELALNNI
jgi:aldehyde:ferredoxin oxidoreductase